MNFVPSFQLSFEKSHFAVLYSVVKLRVDAMYILEITKSVHQTVM